MQTAGLLAIATLASCGPAHVQLPVAPPTSAPLDQRRAWYERLGPDAVVKETVIGKTRRGNEAVRADRWQVALGDGTVVEAPEDLLPEVATTSATARAAQRARSARRSGPILIAAGFAIALVGIGVAAAVGHDTSSSAEPMAFALGGVVGGASMLAFGIVRTVDAQTETEQAFHSYDADLRERLRLCVDGLRVITCEATVER